MIEFLQHILAIFFIAIAMFAAITVVILMAYGASVVAFKIIEWLGGVAYG